MPGKEDNFHILQEEKPPTQTNNRRLVVMIPQDRESIFFFFAIIDITRLAMTLKMNNTKFTTTLASINAF